MVSSAEYLNIINETYDLSDSYTRKKVLYCNEAQKSTNIENIINRLYSHIVNNVDKIDFGTIPKSKGNITKVEGFQNLVDCIDTIHKLILEYNENTVLVDHISTAIDNIQKRQRVFEKAFTLNIELPMILYNCTVLSIVSGVSLLIATCIEYVKNDHDSFTLSFDKVSYNKSKDHVLFNEIIQFNNACKDKSIDKTMDQCIKNNAVHESSDNLNESLSDFAKNIAKLDNDRNYKSLVNIGKLVGNIVAGVATIIMVFKAIKGAIYYSKYFKMKFSNWLSIQADFLAINAENLKYRDDKYDSDEHKQKVYTRQMKMVEFMRKLSNTFMLKNQKAQKDAKDESDHDDNRRYEDNNDDDDGLF